MRDVDPTVVLLNAGPSVRPVRPEAAPRRSVPPRNTRDRRAVHADPPTDRDEVVLERAKYPRVPAQRLRWSGPVRAIEEAHPVHVDEVVEVGCDTAQDA